MIWEAEMSRIHTYREQFERVTRWYQRFEEINTGKEHNKASNCYEDDIYSFFLNCYHLKDWIKHDPTTGNARKEVENFLSNNEYLSLCADICNGLKHLTLTTDRSGQKPQFGKRNFHIQVGGSQQIISVKYTIETKSGHVDAFTLATKCIKAWKSFIQANIK